MSNWRLHTINIESYNIGFPYDITTSITKDTSGFTNVANVRIKGFTDKDFSIHSPVSITAGYTEAGEVEIFKGFLTRLEYQNKRFVSFDISDVINIEETSNFNVSYTEGTLLMNIVQDLASKLGYSIQGQVKNNVSFDNGYVYSGGGLSSILSLIRNDGGSETLVADGVIYIDTHSNATTTVTTDYISLTTIKDIEGTKVRLVLPLNNTVTLAGILKLSTGKYNNSYVVHRIDHSLSLLGDFITTVEAKLKS